MSIDVVAARQFVHANARLLDTHRAAYAFDGAGREPVLATLAAYRNDDGGFGHGLEPDVRGPVSETTSTLHALEVLAEVDALDHPFVAGAADWVAGVAEPDAGVPFVLAESLDYPRGPWMQPAAGGSHLTFGYAAVLGAAGVRSSWLDAATDWCRQQLADPSRIGSYTLKYALQFLDHDPEHDRARDTIEALRPMIRPDGSVPVPGGTDGERLTVTTLSPAPGRLSRDLFTEAQVDTALDDLESAQRDDGGWTVDYLAWCPAQGVEWRGLATLLALRTLQAEGRW